MITIKTTDNVGKRLRKLSDRLGNLEEFFDLFAPFVQAELDDQFRHERDVYGTDWEPLKRETIEQKRRDGKMEKILQRDGLLRDSAVTQAMESSFAAGFELGYGEFHHSKIHRAKGVPRRMLLPDEDKGLPDSWNHELEEQLGDFLKGAWG